MYFLIYLCFSTGLIIFSNSLKIRRSYEKLFVKKHNFKISEFFVLLCKFYINARIWMNLRFFTNQILVDIFDKTTVGLHIFVIVIPLCVLINIYIYCQCEQNVRTLFIHLCLYMFRLPVQHQVFFSMHIIVETTWRC
jgi:hypothetical protein